MTVFCVKPRLILIMIKLLVLFLNLFFLVLMQGCRFQNRCYALLYHRCRQVQKPYQSLPSEQFCYLLCGKERQDDLAHIPGTLAEGIPVVLYSPHQDMQDAASTGNSSPEEQ